MNIDELIDALKECKNNYPPEKCGIIKTNVESISDVEMDMDGRRIIEINIL